MLMKDKILACENHVEEALDDFVYHNEVFPTMNKCSEGKCDYCKENAEYSIEK